VSIVKISLSKSFDSDISTAAKAEKGHLESFMRIRLRCHRSYILCMHVHTEINCSCIYVVCSCLGRGDELAV
jgi:hypothetical protein